MKMVLLSLGIIGTLFLTFMVFGISIMGDRSCRIQIQNGGQGHLILKTFQYTNYDKKLTIDSIALRPKEELQIGYCINCTTPDTLDIDFEAIGFYDPKGNIRMMNKRELIHYLESMKKEDCITYLIE